MQGWDEKGGEDMEKVKQLSVGGWIAGRVDGMGKSVA